MIYLFIVGGNLLHDCYFSKKVKQLSIIILGLLKLAECLHLMDFLIVWLTALLSIVFVYLSSAILP